MTVTTTTNQVSARGGGGATVFSFSPVVLPEASSDLEVVKIDSSGVSTTLSEGTGTANYSVSVASYPGTGSITYPADTSGTLLATGETIVMRRKLVLDQDTDLNNQSTYFSDVLETALDRQTMYALQMQDEINRSIRAPVSETSMGRLPTVANRKGKYLYFNATTGDPEASSASASGAGVSTFWSGVLTDTDAATSRASLGITGTQVDLFVDDYSAVGDGITDDTTAFSNAIAALVQGQRLRLTANKTYIIDGTTDLNVAHTIFDATGATLKLKGSSSNDVKMLTVSANDVVVVGGIWDGNSANQGAATGQVALYHTGRSRVHINVDEIKNTVSYGIRAIDATDCSIRIGYGHLTGSSCIQWEYSTGALTRCITYDSFIDRSDSAANNEKCIEYTKTGSATGAIVDCGVYNCQLVMSNAPTGTNVIGIEMWGAGKRNTIANCTVTGATTGISFANGMTFSTVENCALYDFDTIGIEIADTTYSAVVGNVINGNANGTRGVTVDGASISAVHNSVNDNVISNVTDSAIYVFSGCPYLQVTGNNIDISGAAAYGIYLNVTTYTSISNNTIYGNTTALQGIVGIRSSYITMTGNNIAGFTSQGVLFSQNAAGTMDYITISGGYLPQGYAFQTSGGGALGNHIRLSATLGIDGDADNSDVLDRNNNIRVASFPNEPESVVTAGRGSIGIEYTGSNTNILWVKASGSGTTGWRPVNAFTELRVVTAAGAVTVDNTDHIVVVNKGTGAATTVNLPASPVTGDTYTIKDGKGDAATNNITITPAAGTIDGAATLVLNANYGKATVAYNGTEWNQVA